MSWKSIDVLNKGKKNFICRLFGHNWIVSDISATIWRKREMRECKRCKKLIILWGWLLW